MNNSDWPWPFIIIMSVLFLGICYVAIQNINDNNINVVYPSSGFTRGPFQWCQDGCCIDFKSNYCFEKVGNKTYYIFGNVTPNECHKFREGNP